MQKSKSEHFSELKDAMQKVADEHNRGSLSAAVEESMQNHVKVRKVKKIE